MIENKVEKLPAWSECIRRVIVIIRRILMCLVAINPWFGGGVVLTFFSLLGLKEVNKERLLRLILLFHKIKFKFLKASSGLDNKFRPNSHNAKKLFSTFGGSLIFKPLVDNRFIGHLVNGHWVMDHGGIGLLWREVLGGGGQEVMDRNGGMTNNPIN
jgi:hypothetical protein